jgi:DNA-binding response OmpR family regulator
VNTRIPIVENEANIADDLETGLREEGYAVEHAADVVSGWLHLQAISRELLTALACQTQNPGPLVVSLIRSRYMSAVM